MTTDQALNRVKLNLGALKGFGTTIELTDTEIQSIIEMSLDELIAKVDTPSMLILPYADIIDLRAYKIASIDLVTRAEAPYSVTQGTSYDPFYFSNSTLIKNNVQGGSLNSVLQMQAVYTVRAMAQNTVQAELQHFHDIYNKTLMVSYAGSRPSAVTILYRPEIQCVEDLPSSIWSTFLVRLATAHSKCIIGRVRGKYSVAGSPVTVNNEILSEGTTELSAIYEELDKLTGHGVV